MKKLLVLLFITTFCFSQEKELTISQIDSICLIHANFGFIDNNYEIENEKKENIGKGYYEMKTYIFPKETITLDHEPTPEEVMNEIGKNVLIKGTYNLKNNYNNLEKSEVNLEYYYHNSKLFFVKVILTKIVPDEKPIVETFEFNFDKKTKLNDIKNILNCNLEGLIDNCNSQILSFYN